jgi:hypothetical protein
LFLHTLKRNLKPQTARFFANFGKNIRPGKKERFFPFLAQWPWPAAARAQDYVAQI